MSEQEKYLCALKKQFYKIFFLEIKIFFPFFIMYIHQKIYQGKKKNENLSFFFYATNYYYTMYMTNVTENEHLCM